MCTAGNVALVVSHPRLHQRMVKGHVSTTQIAPTILRTLGLNPFALEAVVKERTQLLPGLGL
jgi:hypothetical protein